ncbi:MAG TPA: NAD(P)/FAD-dependent oxidoreductase [Polyangia bacterium]|nr:NAD(P)/FAD-dependent oxidoreductase [Polyangia bacterium]
MRETGIVVVGAGPAGVAAAAQCARLGIVPGILDRTGRAGGLVASGFLIENYPGLEEPLPGPGLARRFAAHLERFGLSVLTESVTRVEPRGDRWLVTTDAGNRLAGAVLLCVGTRPRPWSVPGVGSAGAGRVFHDVRDLLGRFPEPRRVLVVGGGEAAFDFALSLARTGAGVSILVRSAAPRAVGRLLSLAAGEPRIRVETAVRAVALEPAANGVTAVLETARSVERRVVDAVLAAVGRESGVDGLLPESLRAGMRGAIERAPGLLVCGDARLGSLGQTGIAVGDGLAAASLAMARAREVAA